MYEATDTTTPSRHKERASWDEGVVHATLDEAIIGHLAFVDEGRPHVLPLLFVRVGESVFLHGSTGAHFARRCTRGRSLPVSFEVTLFDALVLARSAFSHSANYRSVVAHGEATLVREDAKKEAVLAALMDKLVPGRNAEARPPRPDELRQTALLELPLTDVAAKVRTGGPLDAVEDVDLPVWAGLRPLVTHWGSPIAADGLSSALKVPSYLQADGCGGGHPSARPGALTA
ncbi:MAG TPA: pyridoxamine 5'-phosphate oxidase family protein [Acidimicrobiales bacterium]|nr:pyridoxamine 5'-phosphate oxidase family protein [Acidimicrobiales bacterium]